MDYSIKIGDKFLTRDGSTVTITGTIEAYGPTSTVDVYYTADNGFDYEDNEEGWLVYGTPHLFDEHGFHDQDLVEKLS